jgi:hypothetical protein
MDYKVNNLICLFYLMKQYLKSGWGIMKNVVKYNL